MTALVLEVTNPRFFNSVRILAGSPEIEQLVLIFSVILSQSVTYFHKLLTDFSQFA